MFVRWPACCACQTNTEKQIASTSRKNTFRTDGRPGCKPVPTRAVLEAVPRILNSGAPTHMLSQCYPNYRTVHRRFQQWCQREVLMRLANTAGAGRDRRARELH